MKKKIDCIKVFESKSGKSINIVSSFGMFTVKKEILIDKQISIHKLRAHNVIVVYETKKYDSEWNFITDIELADEVPLRIPGAPTLYQQNNLKNVGFAAILIVVAIILVIVLIVALK